MSTKIQQSVTEVKERLTTIKEIVEWSETVQSRLVVYGVLFLVAVSLFSLYFWKQGINHAYHLRTKKTPPKEVRVNMLYIILLIFCWIAAVLVAALTPSASRGTFISAVMILGALHVLAGLIVTWLVMRKIHVCIAITDEDEEMARLEAAAKLKNISPVNRQLPLHKISQNSYNMQSTNVNGAYDVESAGYPASGWGSARGSAYSQQQRSPANQQEYQANADDAHANTRQRQLHYTMPIVNEATGEQVAANYNSQGAGAGESTGAAPGADLAHDSLVSTGASDDIASTGDYSGTQSPYGTFRVPFMRGKGGGGGGGNIVDPLVTAASGLPGIPPSSPGESSRSGKASTASVAAVGAILGKGHGSADMPSTVVPESVVSTTTTGADCKETGDSAGAPAPFIAIPPEVEQEMAVEASRQARRSGDAARAGDDEEFMDMKFAPEDGEDGLSRPERAYQEVMAAARQKYNLADDDEVPAVDTDVVLNDLGVLGTGDSDASRGASGAGGGSYGDSRNASSRHNGPGGPAKEEQLAAADLYAAPPSVTSSVARGGPRKQGSGGGYNRKTAGEVHTGGHVAGYGSSGFPQADVSPHYAQPAYPGTTRRDDVAGRGAYGGGVYTRDTMSMYGDVSPQPRAITQQPASSGMYQGAYRGGGGGRDVYGLGGSRQSGWGRTSPASMYGGYGEQGGTDGDYGYDRRRRW